MISKNFAIGEIRLRIAQLIEAGQICDVGAFVVGFLSEKAQIDGPDSDFYRACTAEFVKDTASRVIAKWSPKTKQSAPTLEGFEHLQVAYPVKRQGRQMLVPIGLCSDDELLARAEEYVAMADGCMTHADEIRRFVKFRNSADAV